MTTNQGLDEARKALRAARLRLADHQTRHNCKPCDPDVAAMQAELEADFQAKLQVYQAVYVDSGGKLTDEKKPSVAIVLRRGGIRRIVPVKSNPVLSCT